MKSRLSRCAIAVTLVLAGTLSTAGVATASTPSPPPGPSRPLPPDSAVPVPDVSAAAAPSTPALWRSLRRNRINRAVPVPTNCRRGTVNSNNAASVRAYARYIKGCLDRSWSVALRRAGVSWSSPRLVITARAGTGACGRYPLNGNPIYYCPRNQTVYWSVYDFAKSVNFQRLPHYYIAHITAHEYGHHLQARAGILRAYAWLVQRYGPRKDLELSRRVEMQGNCFAANWWKAERNRYPVGANTLYGLRYMQNIRNSPTHGKGVIYQRWWNHGYRLGRSGACNTWAAPPRDVA